MNISPSIRSANVFRGLDTSLIGSLWFFTVVARQKGFGAAARELYVTQGAVSQRIRQLEHRLGAKLFARMGRGVTLTAAGEDLFAVINGSFHDIEAKIAAFVRDRQQASLVVSCIPSLSMEWLLPRIDSWHNSSNNTKIQIRAEFHRITREIMLNENIDVAIRYDHETYHDLHVIDLFEEKIFPVCTASYWRNNNQLDCIPELSRLTLLHDLEPWVGAERCIEWRSWIESQGASNIDADRGQHYNLAQMAMRAALLDQGLAMGRSILTADYLASGRLMRPFGSAAAPGAKYRLLTLEPVGDSGIVAQFASWMKEELEISAKSVSAGCVDHNASADISELQH